MSQNSKNNLTRICRELDATAEMKTDFEIVVPLKLGKSCPLSDFAWSYDNTLGRCRIVNTEGCPYATENQFATQVEILK